MKAVIKFPGRILVLLLCLLTYLGCSDSAIFEDYGFDYKLSMCVSDDGSSSECTLTVDILQSTCDSGDPEDFYDATGVVTFEVEEGQRNIKLISYTVDYIPEESSASNDGSGSTFTPPSVPRLDGVLDTGWIPPGGTTTFAVVVLDIPRKLDILTQAAAEGHGTVGSPWFHFYTLRVTFRGVDELGDSFTISTDAVIEAGPYDNC